jgi:nitrogen regulatory protein PII-like uncharacterized protein
MKTYKVRAKVVVKMTVDDNTTVEQIQENVKDAIKNSAYTIEGGVRVDEVHDNANKHLRELRH